MSEQITMAKAKAALKRAVSSSLIEKSSMNKLLKQMKLYPHTEEYRNSKDKHRILSNNYRLTVPVLKQLGEA